ncbi:MAG: sigma-70 family RNA polymerase sigma factor [Gemmatales bacterium]|nr:sigma-70 family RNA polymerase sigma factor [Gemmatales bacterium]MDW8223814.1 sigma-70 family RNA polymerase sigma factor [Gemmatales bacterium]
MPAQSQTSIQMALRDPDVALMLRVRDDDAQAFEELVRRYQDRLLTVMYHLVGNRDEADDLAQEVFLRVYRHRKEYHPQAKFSTWLFTIAHHLAQNVYRRRQRKPEAQLDLTDSGMLAQQPQERWRAAMSPAPDAQLRHEELSQVVQEAIAQLNDRQRLAVVLNKFEDMSYQEIADIMQISVKAVKSLLSRARAQLRQLLAPYVQMEMRSGPLPRALSHNATDAPRPPAVSKPQPQGAERHE